MKGLILVIIIFSLVGCKNALDKEKEIKTLVVSKEFEINGAKDTSIYEIGGLALTNDSTFYISDVIDRKIKIFSKRGNFISPYTEKETQLTSVQKIPSNISNLAFDNSSKQLALFDVSSRCVKFFDQKRKQDRQMNAPLPILSLGFDNASNFISSTSVIWSETKYINFWDKNGKNIFSFNPLNLSGVPQLDMFKFCFNKYYNKIIVLYYCRNLIQVYNVNGGLENEFTLPFLPKQSETKVENIKSLIGNIQRETPLHNLFWDITTDNKGKIYLLAGYYSNNGNKKRIYVTNMNGEIQSKIELDEKVNNIYADENNFLFAISEKKNKIFKYRINEK